MLYPYIGAGILLAILCIGAGYYWLAALSFAVCIALHFAMRKRIKPVRGAVPPARPFRRRRKKKLHKHADSDGENAAEAEETETEATEVKETKAEETEAEETEVKETEAK